MTLPTVAADEVPEAAVLLDVREDQEWTAGHIPGATHLPMYRLPAQWPEHARELPTDARIVVVCAVGQRSAMVTEWLLRQGFDAMNLAGGMVAWAASGRPVVTDTGEPGEVW
jgi:rhodanese-related sulfurtransferase